jgi:phosphonoacetate hydrolase
VINVIESLNGVEQVWTAENVAKELEQPLDREGDLAVVSDKKTVIGGSKKNHDLSALKGKRLRTHGSLHEAKVPFILSEPLNEVYESRSKERPLRSREIFEYALNGTNA